MTSIPDISARGSLTLWTKFQIAVGIQNHLFQGSAPFWSHFALYVILFGTKYSSDYHWHSIQWFDLKIIIYLFPFFETNCNRGDRKKITLLRWWNALLYATSFVNSIYWKHSNDSTEGREEKIRALGIMLKLYLLLTEFHLYSEHILLATQLTKDFRRYFQLLPLLPWAHETLFTSLHNFSFLKCVKR